MGSANGDGVDPVLYSIKDSSELRVTSDSLYNIDGWEGALAVLSHSIRSALLAMPQCCAHSARTMLSTWVAEVKETSRLFSGLHSWATELEVVGNSYRMRKMCFGTLCPSQKSHL
ncbi:uncharacterized protein LOC127750585 [Frankliniella occidentalis]|uniref:Uncharacterized protein LOC127750585 n=1 Tax=Frankliniella occidentalis TaxID=133901 RepID=A0A9C6X3R0_FRAOC|nr:uncharacterized protein LOC127750585 [Frankliniella occidentalis]